MEVKILNIAQIDYKLIPIGLDSEMSLKATFLEQNERSYMLPTNIIPEIIDSFHKLGMTELVERCQEFYNMVKPFDLIYIQKII